MTAQLAPDWKTVDAEVVKHIAAHGEKRLAIQQAHLAGADQRALQLAGLSGPIALALFAAGAGAWQAQLISLAVAAGVATAMSVLSIAFCMLAAQPSFYYPSASLPSLLWSTGDYLTSTEAERFGWDAENMDKSIEDNERVLARQARLTTVALVALVVMPVAAFLAWLITWVLLGV